MLDEALSELEALLEQERDAIRRLDGGRVGALARRKQEIVARLNAERGSFRPADVTRLQRITPSLRQNGVLLAHARDILRDALATLRLAAPTTSYGPAPVPASAVPRMLSVRG